ncbi:MAG TPA: LmbE family protein [Planctomycetaceae bacterium]|nr:LmbE family protein [Planctomycetaceae bacterium]
MVDQTLDVIAVGAHPDDAEIGCGGTLARLVQQGYRVGIVDLTDGEPTPGSPGPEVRLAEARRAAETLGVAVRITLDLDNRQLMDSPQARVKLARQFRRFRPRLVLGLGHRTPMASPDHYQAMLITEAAIFYSRLTRWDDQFRGLAPHRVPALMHYFLNFRALSPHHPGTLVPDISGTLETKIAAVACYDSQLPPDRRHLLERIRIFNQQQGRAAGFEAGEVLASPTVLGTRDLMGLLFGPDKLE